VLYSFIPVSLDEAVRIDEKNYRCYKTPRGDKLPSITTILGKTKSDFSKGNIESWMKREGDAAYHIMELAKIYGSKTHEAIEETLHNRNPDLNMEMVSFHYVQLEKYIKKIDNIRGIELVLYSEKLGIAGTADCIAEYDNKLSIIDYKTKRKPQREEWLEDPFIQATFYGIAFEELTGIHVEQIVILVSDEKGGSMEFIKNPDNYRDKLQTRIRLYKEITQF